MPFDKVLVANRGEIAARVLRACRESGLRTVAVCSEADRDSPYTRLADEVREIGPAKVAESYLNLDRILEAARATGAGAIHPGYGFFAENSALVRKIEEAGLAFIGPSSASIALMGDKLAARRTATEAGVPMLPGTERVDGVEEARRLAAEVGFPLVLKPAGGGGGIGMAIVRDAAGLERAYTTASRLGELTFGNPAVYLEALLPEARHVEVQLIADDHGHYVHLGERECSLQRRYQKLIEEAPSPAVDDALRRAMAEAALRLARAIGYRNAGTVEFLLGPDRRFYFLEMNTRIQVEHPVTEMVRSTTTRCWPSSSSGIATARRPPPGCGEPSRSCWSRASVRPAICCLGSSRRRSGGRDGSTRGCWRRSSCRGSRRPRSGLDPHRERVSIPRPHSIGMRSTNSLGF